MKRAAQLFLCLCMTIAGGCAAWPSGHGCAPSGECCPSDPWSQLCAWFDLATTPDTCGGSCGADDCEVCDGECTAKRGLLDAYHEEQYLAHVPPAFSTPEVIVPPTTRFYAVPRQPVFSAVPYQVIGPVYEGPIGEMVPPEPLPLPEADEPATDFEAGPAFEEDASTGKPAYPTTQATVRFATRPDGK